MRIGGGGNRRDKSEPAIVEGLRRYGALVRRCRGDEAPDLVVKYHGIWLPIEVKSIGGTLRPGQDVYPIAHTLDEALQLFGRRP